MRIGSLVYATEQGLGYLAKNFYDAGIITDVLVVEHSSRPTKNWYPGSLHVPIREVAHSAVVRDFCRKMDVMLFFETPFDWWLIQHCRDNGVRTALMPMFECMPKTHIQPDIVINPSLLDQQYYPQGTFAPIPSNVPWRQRTRANVFVHNAGHGGLRGRNGTKELLEALQYVQSPLKLIVRSQEPLKSTMIGPRMAVNFQGNVPYDDLWTDGDVFVFPEKFNGLSLPLQEAYASGMLVMCGNRFPMNTWLPEDPLIPVDGYRHKVSVSPRTLEFDEAVYDPKQIARTMDNWFGRDIESYSRQGRQWAEENSWIKLKDKYMEILCASST